MLVNISRTKYTIVLINIVQNSPELVYVLTSKFMEGPDVYEVFIKRVAALGPL